MGENCSILGREVAQRQTDRIMANVCAVIVTISPTFLIEIRDFIENGRINAIARFVRCGIVCVDDCRQFVVNFVHFIDVSTGRGHSRIDFLFINSCFFIEHFVRFSRYLLSLHVAIFASHRLGRRKRKGKD